MLIIAQLADPLVSHQRSVMLAMQANRAKARDLGQSLIEAQPPLDTQNTPFFSGFYVEQLVQDFSSNSSTKDGLNYLKVVLVANMTILPDTRMAVVQSCFDCK